MEIYINEWGNNCSEVMGFWELEVDNQYAAKACDELSSALNLSNMGETRSLIVLSKNIMQSILVELGV